MTQINTEVRKRGIHKEICVFCVFCGFSFLAASLLHAQDRTVDFRYAPARHLNIICLPDDWLKSLVNEKGELAYDFGPGPYARPLTTVGIGVRGRDLPLRHQALQNARIPIATTSFGDTSDVMVQQVFSLLPARREQVLSPPSDAKVIRLGGLTGAPDWATPEEGVDDAFRNVAWGTNRPILYRVKVTPGSRHRVAIGLCESYKSRPRMRFFELRVEGAPSRVVDPLADSVKNRPHVFVFDAHDEDANGILTIEAHAAPISPDPNVLLNAFWVFPENIPLDPDSIIRGRMNRRAEVHYSCGREAETYARVPRIDGMRATFADRTLQPQIRVTTRRRLTYDRASGALLHEGMPFILSRPRPVNATKADNGWILNLEPGVLRVEIITIHGSTGRTAITSIPDLAAEMKKASAFWLSAAGLPYARITVPDSGIQYVLDASVRTLYQVREFVDSNLQFQPGPTVYRGLWAGDVVLSGIPVATLGDTSSMRRFIETTLRYQQPDGQIRVMVPHNTLAETPCVITAMCLYASCAGNDRWLDDRWGSLQDGIRWIERKRSETLADRSLPFAGLMPPSFVDGGLIEPTADFGTAWWCMVALEKAIDAAERLGKMDDARRWKVLYEDFSGSIRAAMRRDMRTSIEGHRYLPVGVADTSQQRRPQSGQYIFLFALRYGNFFHSGDSTFEEVVRSNMAMLDHSTKEGLIYGSGWLSDGVWGWLGGIHGIGHNLLGNTTRAQDLLYAYANHASPLGTWVEEQQPRDVGTAVAGDASDAEASAVFVQCVRDLLVVEKNNSLVFLPGVPASWLAGGRSVSMESVFTEYGPVRLRVTVAKHSARASITVTTPNHDVRAPQPRIRLTEFSQGGFILADGSSLPEFIPIAWGATTTLEFIRPE